jgi:PTS system mannose-specific IIA component
MNVIEGAAPGGNQSLVGGVIVSHAHLGNEFLAAAEMILGRPLPHITSASIDWHDDVDVARHELERAIARVSQGRGVLLITDMFGGAPTDVASMFLDDDTVEVVSGVNLPMVLKLARQDPGASLAEVAKGVRDSGAEGIQLASELLPRTPKSA